MAKRKSYYEILGVSDDADEKEIRKAYRRAIIANHPDVNQQSSERAQRRTRDLNAALEVLSNPDLRRQYDEKLARRAAAKQRQAEKSQPPQNDASYSDGHGGQYQSDDDFWKAFEEDVPPPEPTSGRRKQYQKNRAAGRTKRTSKKREWHGWIAVAAVLVPLLVGTVLFMVSRKGNNPSVATGNGESRPKNAKEPQQQNPPVVSFSPTNRQPSSGASDAAKRGDGTGRRTEQPGNASRDAGQNGPSEPSSGGGMSAANGAFADRPSMNRPFANQPSSNRAGSADSSMNRTPASGGGDLRGVGRKGTAPSSNRQPARPPTTTAGSSGSSTAKRRLALSKPRIPVPNSTERELASEEFMQRYRGRIEFANRQRGVERQSKLRDLAGEFFDLFVEGGQPAEEYVWLQAAHQSAIESGHPEFTTDVIQAYLSRFEMDEVELCSAAVQSWAAQLPKEGLYGQPLATRKRMLLDLILPVAKRAHFEHNFDLAATLYNLANQHNEENDLLRAEISRLRGQAITKTEWTATASNDSAIVPKWWITLGVHWCFEMQSWREGLDFFTKGGDSSLAEAAKGELKEPATVAEQIQQGDLWRNLASSVPRHELSFLRRAEYWYKVGFSNGDVADQQKLAVRIRELQKRTRPSTARNPFSQIAGKRFQVQWSNYLRRPVTEHNSIGMSFQLIPPGTFLTGESQRSEQSMKHAIYLATQEVSQDQYSRVMGENPSWFSADGGGKEQVKGRTSNMPVEYIRYEDAVRYCEALSELPRERKAGRSYRLPTEIEWEFACRAGTDTDYSFGDNPQRLFQFAWYKLNSEQFPHFIGRRPPNRFGLRDMHGNVWEWCTRSNYGAGSALDRARIAIRRGGSWASAEEKLVSGYRDMGPADERHADCGFRIVLVAEPYQEAVDPND